jgi:RNA polymerase-binding transcription factor DksA
MRKRKQLRGRRKPPATTQDVLGTGGQSRPIPSKWRAQYKNLVQLRNRLLNRQDDLAKDALEESPTFSTHMADAGTDNFDRDLALGMLSSEQDAVNEIEQAIDRIQNGTYGVCELTGKRIERERLEAIPWTRFSLAAEKQLEAQGARPRTRLGSRSNVPRGGEPDETGEAFDETPD